MKKLAFAFLGVSLSIVSIATQARVYTVSFFNPIGNYMSQSVTPNNNATHIECSGFCSPSLPSYGTATYTISSDDSKIPLGAFNAVFQTSNNSNDCDTGYESTTFKYEITNSSTAIPNFYINVGAPIPAELGSMTITKHCFN